MPFKQYIAGGVKSTGVGFYDDDGFMCGAAGALAEGEDSGLLPIIAVKNIEFTVPEPDRQTQTGDDTTQGSLTFASTDSVTLGIQAGIADMDVEAALMNVKAVSVDGMYAVTINPDVEELALFCMLTSGTAKKRAFGAPQKGFEVYVINQAEAFVTGADGIAERTLRNYDYVATADQTGQFPWGEAMSGATDGALRGAGRKYISKYPVWMHAFRPDGSVSEVTLDKTPAGDHTTDYVQVWSIDIATGVATKMTPGTDFEVDTTTPKIVFGTVAVPAAPSAGAHIVIQYRFVTS